MIIFTVPKPFRGEFAFIQENAIESWLAIVPKPTIILLGDEEGVADIAKQNNLARIIKIKKSRNGTPLLSDIFEQVQKETKEEVLMYINTDIILIDSPILTIDILKKRLHTFLAVGRRYEMKINRRMHIKEVKKKISTNTLPQKSDSWMDYFIFTRGVFNFVPPFALGRTFWDKWLVWNTLQQQIPVVNITDQLYAIHQSHSYTIKNKTSFNTVWTGQEALENLRLAGGWGNSATVSDATLILIKGGLYAQKQKTKSNRYILDIFPALWPLFLKIRLLREKYFSIMNKKRG